jgi:hypothetical protein
VPTGAKTAGTPAACRAAAARCGHARPKQKLVRAQRRQILLCIRTGAGRRGRQAVGAVKAGAARARRLTDRALCAPAWTRWRGRHHPTLVRLITWVWCIVADIGRIPEQGNCPVPLQKLALQTQVVRPVSPLVVEPAGHAVHAFVAVRYVFTGHASTHTHSEQARSAHDPATAHCARVGSHPCTLSTPSTGW